LLCPTAFGAIVCGGIDGSIGLVDLRQGRSTAMATSAHSGTVLDLDLYDRTLITCGTTADGRADPFVKIFDVRMSARTLGVLQLHASCLRFLPGHMAKAMFVNPIGQVQTYCDLHLGANARVEQMDQIQSGGGEVIGMEVSAVGRAAVFCDSEGFVHLWTDDESWLDESNPVRNINPYPEPLEDLPSDSFTASDKRMSELEFWDDAYSDLVSQASFLGLSLSAAQLEEMQPAFVSELPPLLMDKLVEERTLREIRPDLAKRAQTRRDFPGQYLESRPEEFVMNQALVFGQETSKRAYITAADLDEREEGGDAGGEDESGADGSGGAATAGAAQLQPSRGPPAGPRCGRCQTLGSISGHQRVCHPGSQPGGNRMGVTGCDPVVSDSGHR
jgi:hypothetical protein